jgi:hypothetical protein
MKFVIIASCNQFVHLGLIHGTYDHNQSQECLQTVTQVLGGNLRLPNNVVATLRSIPVRVSRILPENDDYTSPPTPLQGL